MPWDSIQGQPGAGRATLRGRQRYPGRAVGGAGREGEAGLMCPRQPTAPTPQRCAPEISQTFAVQPCQLQRSLASSRASLSIDHHTGKEFIR